MINLPIKQLLIVVSLLCYAIPTSANSPITLFYNSQQKPKAWKDHQGQAQGFAFEVAASILKTAKISYITKGVPFNRGLELTKQCRGIMTGVFKTDEREQVLSFSLAIVPDEAVVITRADSQLSYEKIDDLRGNTIAYLRGAVFGNEFEQIVNELKTVTLQDPSTILKVLVKGRVDVAILNPGRATVKYAAQDAGINMRQLHIAPVPLAKIYNYLVTCNQHSTVSQPLLPRINSAILTLKNKGRFKEIMAAYN